MAVDKQEFTAGTRLTGRYKKATYMVEVVETGEGKRIRLEDGREYKSLSAAGSAIMGGKAVNGWRFWSLESEGAAQAGQEQTERPNGKERKPPALRPMSSQEGVPNGQTRWWCEACCDAFLAPASITPVGCPQGHSAKTDGNCQVVTAEESQGATAEAQETEEVPF